MQSRTFTLEELALYNGQNGASAFIAFRGRVYDVTHSYHWRNGKHWVTHRAGTDLTAELKNAPHGEDMLSKFEMVGVLQPIAA